MLGRMKQTGRVVSTLAGLTLALSASTAALAETELRITHTMTGGGFKTAFDQIVASFEEANPDVTVTEIVFDDDLYQDTGLITQLQSSQVPDIYFQWAGFPVSRDVEGGFAMDLTDALATDGWKESFVESVWTEGAGTMVDGVPYMIPRTIDVTTTLWYNTAIWEENGLSVPETWDAFIAAIKTLVEAGETPIVVGNNQLWPLGNWASHVAARVVPPDEFDAAFSQQGSFDTPNFMRALELMEELHEAGAFNRDMPGLGADPAMATFFQEAAVMHPIGSWLVPMSADLAEEGFAYDHFNTPVIDTDHPYPNSAIGVVTGFMVHDRSPNKDEAIAFLKHFTSPESQKIWAEAGAISPVRGVDDMADTMPQMQSLAAMLAEADALVPAPDTTYPVAVAEAYYQAAAYVAAGERTPEEAMAWLVQTVDAMGQQ